MESRGVGLLLIVLFLIAFVLWGCNASTKVTVDDVINRATFMQSPDESGGYWAGFKFGKSGGASARFDNEGKVKSSFLKETQSEVDEYKTTLGSTLGHKEVRFSELPKKVRDSIRTFVFRVLMSS